MKCLDCGATNFCQSCDACMECGPVGPCDTANGLICTDCCAHDHEEGE